MLSERLKQFRLSKGWSLDELSAEIGGIVSKNALSKYERGLMQPSISVLTKLAQAFNIKALQLTNPPDLSTEFIAYRKGSGLGKKKKGIIENLVKTELEERIKLQEKIGILEELNLPIKTYQVNNLADSEDAAKSMRKFWNLGLNPIANLTALLEQNKIHVILKDTPTKFDGISALTKYNNDKLIAAAVVSRKGVPGDRQRLNLAHELGHIVLKVALKVDEEKAAFRFGAAFLAPRESIYELIGSKRSSLQFAELVHYKKYYGISIQALIYRLQDLEVISKSYTSRLFQIINQKGWKKNEPAALIPEKPLLFRSSVMRAFSEKIISASQANRLLGANEFKENNLALREKQEFLKLDKKKRDDILEKQAEKEAAFYKENAEWKEFTFGDIIEY
ncbi:MAG: XRE family transcriptional regulator [Melioribacteraceae bacterium]|nr:XRE family transcriptional regulator [Melioribacteraceae bacterium]MCF8355011.1 XRE family transcriptional regulator [Melioribacteraceae bacterium]MCF8394336.1 XRE family transcriptional regulator [Melioribacteraceae bacterium]MCF8420015.1 XRE family transcriptional regulator [Melioribacteraceae bacterium]